MPLAGDTGFHAEPTAVRDVIESLNLIKGERAGADQTHVSREDIDELWQLIDTEFSKKRPEWENARIRIELEYRPLHLVAVLFLGFLEEFLGVCDHGAEFPHPEGFAILAGAHLREHHGSTRTGDFDADGCDDPEGKRKENHQQGADPIDEFLAHQFPGKLRGRAEHQHRL